MTDGEDIVVIAHLFTNLREWVEFFKAKEYLIEVIIMVRDPWVQVRSRAKAASQSHLEGLARYHGDYMASFQVIVENNLPFTLVPYESLLRPGATDRMLSHLGLRQIKPLVVQGKETEIRNENEKWYAGL